MNLNENIKNAVLVLNNTYESIEKLMKYCDYIANEHKYISVTDKFLRYKSDRNVYGWFPKSFIKLYQHDDDKSSFESDWRDGPVYVLEVNLEVSPCIKLGKFSYENMETWGSKVSPSEHWGFSVPMNQDIEGTIKSTIDITKNITKVLFETEIGEKYWNLNQVTYSEVSLDLITNESVNDYVFGRFELLRSFGY